MTTITSKDCYNATYGYFITDVDDQHFDSPLLPQIGLNGWPRFRVLVVTGMWLGASLVCPLVQLFRVATFMPFWDRDSSKKSMSFKVTQWISELIHLIGAPFVFVGHLISVIGAFIFPEKQGSFLLASVVRNVGFCTGQWYDPSARALMEDEVRKHLV